MKKPNFTHCSTGFLIRLLNSQLQGYDRASVLAILKYRIQMGTETPAILEEVKK